MRSLLVLFSIIAFVLSHCPPDFELVRDGECRGHYAKIDTTSKGMTDDAIAKCKEIQGLPIIIHNEEHQTYWNNTLKVGNQWVPIGLVCNKTSKQWEWADGSALDYKPPSYYSALDKDCLAGHSWQMHSETGKWDWDYGSTAYKTDVFCTTQLIPKIPDEGCYNFESDSEDDVCYQIGDSAESWNDAQLICRKLGANLASVHNSQENSFIRRLAVSNGAVHEVYLGATVSGKGGEFGWIDGTQWDFDYFYPGFPKAGFGDCVVMDTSTSSGQWKNIDCTTQLPVACVRKLKPPVVANATCSTETWKEGSIITSPGFPYSSSMPCDYYLMTDVGKKVEVEIVLLEANSCCDSLIIYDGYVGGYELATLTGEVRNVTYTTTTSNIMLVTWQPNGGVNVMGFAMTFRGV